MKNLIAASLLFSACAMQASASTYELPSNGSTVVGDMNETRSVTGDTLVSLGRRYNLGIMELREANPQTKIDEVLPPGMDITLPTFFVLPNAPHKGIVINIAELRLYFYPPNTREVMTFPVGVGRQGWDSPLGETFIARKKADPTWIPTKHILESRLKDGVILPPVVHPGPDNPLGPYALYTGIPAILIHGSNDPSGIGRRSSSGCIRMQPEAIESFFDLIPPNLPVFIVDEPIKTGWLNNDLYMEVHIPLDDDAESDMTALLATMHKVVDAATAKRPAKIDWSIAERAAKEQRGYPIKIGEGTGHIPEVTIPINPGAPKKAINKLHTRETIAPSKTKKGQANEAH